MNTTISFSNCFNVWLNMGTENKSYHKVVTSPGSDTSDAETPVRKQSVTIQSAKPGGLVRSPNAVKDKHTYSVSIEHNLSTNCRAPNAQCKSLSLPNHHTCAARDYNTMILDALRVSPEDFATQLTLLDLVPFKHISPDELTSCAWNKKNKSLLAPNVVALTRRFNHVSFWTVQEVLSSSSAKHRSEIVTHFIKIAKKLYELNNLHALFAIISALQSAPVYRLTRTWSHVSKKDKQTFDRLCEVFSDTDNWSRLREHMERCLKLPCIPYLGLYLTDLVYIDMAHPHSGGLESQQRQLKMNNILRVIANYQQSSDYSHLPHLPHIQHYLRSIRYIEELQKFVEDDQYKLSLKLEPSSSTVSSSTSFSSKESIHAKANHMTGVRNKSIVSTNAKNHVTMDVTALASLNLSPAKASSGSVRLHNAVTQAGSKFMPGHRKCRSLGTNIFHHRSNTSVQPSNDLLMPIESQALHLLDDSVLEETIASVQSSHVVDGDKNPQPTHLVSLADVKLQNAKVVEDKEEYYNLLGGDESNGTSSNDLRELSEYLLDDVIVFEDCVKRKTILKDGKKPTVAAWQRYWLQLWTTSLVYFSPKSFKGSTRSDFKRDPCKIIPIVGWTAHVGHDSSKLDTFQLTDPSGGRVYKFRVGSRPKAERWCKIVKQLSHPNNQRPLPANLMCFD